MHVVRFMDNMPWTRPGRGDGTIHEHCRRRTDTRSRTERPYDTDRTTGSGRHHRVRHRPVGTRRPGGPRRVDDHHRIPHHSHHSHHDDHGSGSR
ncbi:hypothetical protein HEK616_64530 [Streptomyces nigrescens]|uniref:Uncharacterized protein n=1 Tax=Streptomyces nigrescens TaxID=1920 RepID=A0ABM8A372_STRNI|nr:hypothetical protein HEK616_64530 [Streptomyces nigrescens]